MAGSRIVLLHLLGFVYQAAHLPFKKEKIIKQAQCMAGACKYYLGIVELGPFYDNAE
jgi:hypothetical protein